MLRRSICLSCLIAIVLAAGCTRKEPKHFTHEVLNRMTPVKDQGERQTCWIYAMLAAIETERLAQGDSVNLSPAYIEKVLEQEASAPESRRGMGVTLLRLIEKYGIVGYDEMSSASAPLPSVTLVHGKEHTPQEFARSICAPDEYVALTSNSGKPYYKEVDINLPDNWLRNRFLNIPIDSLLAKTERAVRQHHGVCWESKSHAMAIVGIAHDENGEKYFIMKNSWGADHPHKGLKYISFSDFRRKTLAVEMKCNDLFYR